MVNIGDQLLEPEEGWKRINDTDPLITYNGSFLRSVGSPADIQAFNKDDMFSKEKDATIVFYVYSSRLRIISYKAHERTDEDHMEFFANGISIGKYNQYTSTDFTPLVLAIDKDFGKKSFNKIEVKNISSTGEFITFDAMDIDEDGFLLSETDYKFFKVLKNNSDSSFLSNDFPVKVADDTIETEEDIKDYSATLTEGEKQLLLKKSGEMYLTNGDGTYEQLSSSSTLNDEQFAELKLKTVVGEDLDYGYFVIGENLEIEEGSNYSFKASEVNGISYNETDRTITLNPNRKYRISANLFGTNKVNTISYIFYNYTDKEYIGPTGTGISTSYVSNWNDCDLDFIYKTDKEITISLREFSKTNENYKPSVESGNIVIQEIGREVIIDPTEKVNEENGIEDSPVGSIISYIGEIAPKHYLTCDGTEYNITDYPKLAEHFKEQFGLVDYYGGDGTKTFSVPDTRENENLKAWKFRIYGEIAPLRKYLDSASVSETRIIKKPSLTLNIKDLYTAFASTYIFVKEEQNLQVYLTTLNEGSFYLNDELLSETESNIKQEFNLSLKKGINRIDVLYHGKTGDDGFVLTPDLLDLFPSNYNGTFADDSIKKCIKYEPTYFMKINKTGTFQTKKVLFEGKANEINTTYKLNDNLDNYDYIYIKTRTILSNDSNFISTDCINTDDINSDNLYQTSFHYLCSGNFIVDSTTLLFPSNNEFSISEKILASFSDWTDKDIAIEKIIGVKDDDYLNGIKTIDAANKLSVDENNKLNFNDKVLYTEDEIKGLNIDASQIIVKRNDYHNVEQTLTLQEALDKLFETNKTFIARCGEEECNDVSCGDY